MIDDLPADADVERLRREAREASDAYRGFLAHAAYLHNLDVAVLSKIATDQAASDRERLRAAAQLLKYRFEAMAALVGVTAAREQNLERLGIKQGGPAVALTQVNQTIEIVRTSDWRAAGPLVEGDDVVVDSLPEGKAAADGKVVLNGKARPPADAAESDTDGGADAEDPAS